jgi:hypothetical protein
MRMIIPGLRERRTVDRLLTAFFRDYRVGDFRAAIVAMSRFFSLRTPRVEWFEYLDWGKTGGRTYENGKIQLVHPENWKQGRKYNTERQWIHTVYHEMGHYVLWSDAERKADNFAYRFIYRVFANGTRAGLASKAKRKRPRRTTPTQSRPRHRRRRSRSR